MTETSPNDVKPKSDPFDPERLRLSQDYAVSLGVQKKTLTIPTRKPDGTWWVQTPVDEEYQMPVCVLELKEEREIYLVDSDLRAELATESTVGPRLMVPTLNRQGVLFFWPIRLPGADGKLDEWSRSAAEAADLARGRWIRVASNMSLGAYEVFTTSAALPDPIWPDKPIHELLRIAFKDRVIDTFDHPVLRRLRGEL
ncbi:MAG: hypothetical protein JWN70_6156 [Planctomycetaceae bacterium]|nr:hypothetical protein [Planctomycetaceae bacterium]